MRNKLIFYLSALFFLPGILYGGLDATESDFDRQIREDDEAIQSYHSANNINAQKMPSGVYIEVLRENDQGKQVAEDHVAGILYTMTHLAGEYEIEAHSDTLNPLRFSNSYNFNYNAIHPAGLNYEISRMREGENFRFYIPSYQAFGNYSHNGLFDSFSNFIVEVDLIELKTEDEIYEEELQDIKNYIEVNEIEAEAYPNGLFFVTIKEGGGENPGSTSPVEFHYTRKYLDGSVIGTSTDDDPIQANLNDNQLVRGLEEGISLMREGGKALLIMPSKMAFGKSVQVIPQRLRADWVEEESIQPLAKPYTSVMYEVELLKVN